MLNFARAHQVPFERDSLDCCCDDDDQTNGQPPHQLLSFSFVVGAKEPAENQRELEKRDHQQRGGRVLVGGVTPKQERNCAQTHLHQIQASIACLQNIHLDEAVLFENIQQDLEQIGSCPWSIVPLVSFRLSLVCFVVRIYLHDGHCDCIEESQYLEGKCHDVAVAGAIISRNKHSSRPFWISVRLGVAGASDDTSASRFLFFSPKSISALIMGAYAQTESDSQI